MPNFKIVESSPVPLYVQVKDNLRERIYDGTYGPHAQLPPESELGTLFGVSRITVRQALSDLQREGAIFKIPGKGTFVAKKKAEQELTRLEGFAEAMNRQGYDIYNRVLSHRLLPATAEVAQKLALEVGTIVAEIRRLRHLNGEPVSLEITYLPAELGQRLRNEDLAGRDIFLIFENDFDIALGHADLQIGAVTADQPLAEALQVAEGAALLRIERLTSTADGKPLDFEYLYFRSETFQYHLRIARRPVAASQDQA
ncbi:GntR family transcriptional regulator [Herbaspirillum sp. Sphag1AN]|uniref:GntR family transcriptional regulator n=1 Tax=unclassified Herbaspirillum TaxID=2624150 RepID=UPI00160B5768|nr:MULTISPECIES: GntR family transcriptional regulator [unclassified Herbaspirillum]MBB3211852.1 GntR family transcriptional regulator [Herbaspirillum sp. Sphag1AN]MBB3244314.1 GntR family transcriptional regulator [Herbaspirillum sp. Sphag64]